MGIGVAGMIITSDYGSFPHSLRLAPVRKLRLWEAQILILCSILRCSKSSDSRTRRCHMSWRAFGLALDSVVLLWVMRSAEGTTSRLRTDRVLGFPLSEHPTVWGKLLLHLRAPTVAGTALWYCQAANSSQRNRRRIGKSTVDCLQDGEGPQLIIPCSWALRGACRKRGERVGRGRAVSSSLQHWDLQISSKVRRPKGSAGNGRIRSLAWCRFLQGTITCHTNQCFYAEMPMWLWRKSHCHPFEQMGMWCSQDEKDDRDRDRGSYKNPQGMAWWAIGEMISYFGCASYLRT
jgi:hypothetical protein